MLFERTLSSEREHHRPHRQISRSPLTPSSTRRYAQLRRLHIILHLPVYHHPLTAVALDTPIPVLPHRLRIRHRRVRNIRRPARQHHRLVIRYSPQTALATQALQCIRIRPRIRPRSIAVMFAAGVGSPICSAQHAISAEFA